MMPTRRQFGFMILFAGFLVLAAFVVVVGFMPQQPGLKLAKWTVRARCPDVHSISTAQLADSLADSRRAPPVLLDARTEDEFYVSHLPSAVREVQPEAIAAGRPILAYCCIGWRSAEAVLRFIRSVRSLWMNFSGSHIHRFFVVECRGWGHFTQESR